MVPDLRIGNSPRSAALLSVVRCTPHSMASSAMVFMLLYQPNKRIMGINIKETIIIVNNGPIHTRIIAFHLDTNGPRNIMPCFEMPFDSPILPFSGVHLALTANFCTNWKNGLKIGITHVFLLLFIEAKTTDRLAPEFPATPLTNTDTFGQRIGDFDLTPCIGRDHDVASIAINLSIGVGFPLPPLPFKAGLDRSSIYALLCHFFLLAFSLCVSTRYLLSIFYNSRKVKCFSREFPRLEKTHETQSRILNSAPHRMECAFRPYHLRWHCCHPVQQHAWHQH